MVRLCYDNRPDSLLLTYCEAFRKRRGQIGTVVMSYKDGACEIEFADRDGRAFAILSLRPDQLMVLHDTPDFAAV